MTHGSLFSGIGGFDLAADWMGWQNVFHCEWNNFGQRVLKHYWPNAISYHDITKTDFTIHRGRIDILTGGFPCQPYSMAGKRLGKEDDRHLWPSMLRAIREIQPRWVVGENVLGLVNWSGGLVFHEVQADLEAEGYEVQPFVLPAVSVNAPHRRDRVWFVAHANRGRMQESILQHADISSRSIRNYQEIATDTDSSTTGTPREGRSIKSNWSGDNVQQSERREQTEQHNRSSAFSWDATNTDGVRLEQRKNSGEMGVRQTKICGAGGEFADATQTNGAFSDATHTNVQRLERECGPQRKLEGPFGFIGTNPRNMQCPSWENFPTVSPICDGNDGISDRLDGITFSKWRQESIKAGGNAVVPQVVLQIFRTIEEYEKMNTP